MARHLDSISHAAEVTCGNLRRIVIEASDFGGPAVLPFPLKWSSRIEPGKAYANRTNPDYLRGRAC